MKILVVDDEASNRALVVTLIHHRGHEALEAGDGAEALAVVRSQLPALVISDILMPTMDGFEFVRQLRADPAMAATEVIFYTAHYREREARNLAAACGVSRVLIKPCEPQDILEAIDASLSAAPTPTPVPETADFDRDHLRLVTDKLSQQLDTLQATNQRLGALNTLNLHLASERDPRLLLEKFCRSARDLLGARFAVLRVNGKRDEDEVFTTAGFEPGLAQQLARPRVDGSLLEHVRSDGRPVRVAASGGGTIDIGLPPGYPPMRSALVASVVSLTHDYGWICMADKVGADAFTFEDERILSILAAQVGRIFENGSLYAELRQRIEQVQVESAERKRAVDELRETTLQLKALSARVLEAQETERRRVAHELHDELGQSLTAIKINVQARGRFGDGSCAGSDAETLRIVDDALDQVRRLALALRPSMLDDLGLAPALRWIAEQTAARTGLAMRLDVQEHHPRLAPELETACFRIVQESLTNIMRHARAKEVHISLHKNGDDLLLVVRDDGVGFDLAGMRSRAVAGGSMGVLGMQERATLVGGRLDIETVAGKGSALVLRCPWRILE